MPGLATTSPTDLPGRYPARTLLMQARCKPPGRRSNAAYSVRSPSISRRRTYEPVLANHADRVPVGCGRFCERDHLLWPNPGICRPLVKGTRGIETTASGVLFGIATAAALMLPLHLDGGAAVGCNTILLALVGPLAGNAAIVGGLVSSIAIELLPWASREQSIHAAVLSLFVSAAIGFLFQLALRYRPGSRGKQLRYIHLPVLGMLSAAGDCSCWHLPGGRRM